jgi:hypothetical protein
MFMPRILLGATITAVLSMALTAQQAPTGYHHVQCVKVNPGQGVAFEQYVSGPLQKLDQALIDSGAYAQTLVLRTRMPRGTEAECDYVFVSFYKGMPTTGLNSEELSKALHDADIPMTADAVHAKQNEMGKLVNENITQYQSLVGRAKKGDYLVFNSMSAPDTRACVDAQKKTWQPVAEEMVKAGNLDAWAVNVQVFPRGAKDQNAVSSVDIYPSWDAFTNENRSVESAWKKVHSDMDINNTMNQFGKMCTIEHTVLYEVVGVTSPAK